MSRPSSSARTRTVAVALALAGVAMLVLVSSAAGKPAAKKPVTIALFVAIQSNPVEQAIINNVQGVAKADGAVKVDVFDSNNSVQKEISNCNDAIAAHKYDAFALKAVAGPPLMNCARKAIKAGIPVVAFGNALGPNPDTYKRQIPGLSGSVIELARINGASVASLTEAACKAKQASPCNVIYTYGPLAFDWASISRKFFLSTVKAKYPNIKVIATGLNNFDPNAARTLTKSLVQTHSNVDVIASDGDLGAEGVIAGLKDLGKKPGQDVYVTGGAISKQGAGLIQSGAMFGSTCLMPATEAKTAAKLTILAARHQKIAQPDVEVCAASSPTGNAPITKANLSKFHPEW
jgi:ribose transport system substrate-binding protein